ncbi:hypothetical protein DYB30_013882 [Aphanomyces astaci]|uniref:Uncharacterized protein n=1 Tax=Aphanomyces astaci TaxID=112090 RepID=A0A397E6G3_APHAT|nr:hypothetical protein DYB30_013882 [Aphanomyces astaci]
MHMPQLGELRRVSLTLPMVKANPKVRRVPIDRSHAAAFQKLLSSFDEGDNVRRYVQVFKADVNMLGDATFRDHQRRLTDELACERNRVKALEMKGVEFLHVVFGVYARG